MLLVLLVPIEILSYFIRPFTLSIRLFANMLAGHTMLAIFGGFAVMLGSSATAPLAFNVVFTGLELLVAFLQAYVFAILTCLYLHDALHLHSLTERNTQMDLAAAKMIGAGLACIALVGVGVGIGNVFGADRLGGARNPGPRPACSAVLLGFALAEATGLFGLAIAFLILFVF